MADALIKYETIDIGQIEAIMAGREPPPPADWGSGDEPPNDEVKKTTRKKKTSPGEGSIGGPASLH
jgi:cell division protease FtsH